MSDAPYPAPEATPREGGSTVKKLLVGCLGLGALGFLITVGITFFGVRAAKDGIKNAMDPERNREVATRVLGVDALPGSYEPTFCTETTLPFGAGQMTLINLEADLGKPGSKLQRKFDFIISPRLEDLPEKLQQFADGSLEQLPAVPSPAAAQADGILWAKRGTLSTPRQPVSYVVGTRAPGGARTTPSVMVVLVPTCANRDALRVALWHELNGEPLDATAPPAGSLADPNAMMEMIGDMNLCGEGAAAP